MIIKKKKKNGLNNISINITNDEKLFHYTLSYAHTK